MTVTYQPTTADRAREWPADQSAFIDGNRIAEIGESPTHPDFVLVSWSAGWPNITLPATLVLRSRLDEYIEAAAQIQALADRVLA